MHPLRLIPLVLALALPLPALADAEKRRAALLLLESDQTDALIAQMAAAPVRELMHATVSRNPEMTQGQQMVLSALYHEEMHAAALEALSTRATGISDRYSLAELEALRRFGATEEGRALLAEQPSLLGGLDHKITAAMLARMDAAFARYGDGV